MTTRAVPVDPANAEQLRAWDGDEGAYWAEHGDQFDRGVAAHHAPFMAAAAIDRQDHVLDIGCGTGETSLDAARAATEGFVVGMDLSAAMLDVARRRAHDLGLSNVRFEQADVQIHPFTSASFDVAIGRTSAMFFADRVAGLANVARALRPGGRLVLLTWQAPTENEWVQQIFTALSGGRPLPTPPPDAPGPFTLADPAVVQDVLTRAGYEDITLDPSRQPMWFGSTADEAFSFVLGLMGWMLNGLDDAGRARALDALRRTIDEHQRPDGVLFDSAAWIIRARTRP